MSRNIQKAFEAHAFDDGKWVGDDDMEIEAAPDSLVLQGQDVRVIFADLDKEVLRWIAPFDAVVGCVAWLTNKEILAAINKKQVGQIVMQKEDWLRPDGHGDHPARGNGELYRQNAGFDRISRPINNAGLNYMSYKRDEEIGRYRVFGVVDKESREKRPILHHKFLVGCDLERESVRYETAHGEIDELWGGELTPRSVWTGSFNMTNGSHRNMDSVVVMGEAAAQAYFMEWRDLFIHSEPLNFEGSYYAPEWRIGS